MFDFNAVGGTGALTWSISDLPPGMEFDEALGILSGTPTETGTFTFTITVTDALDRTSSSDFSLIVKECEEVVYAILEEGGPGLMEEGGEAAFLEE